ncbi:hypothetical protein DV737_g397, partial [Chaetothyriales sp. CBS 132003]
MPPFRIPFTNRRPLNSPAPNGENIRPAAAHDSSLSSPYHSKSSLALNNKERSEEPNEFKLSSVDSQGQYLPPSPSTEPKSFWSKSPSCASNHRSLVSDNEPFSISRESFESYRRSFDISGRSPILHADSYASRTSLDSRSVYLSRPALNGGTFRKPGETRDDGFEDVKLNDDASRQQQPKKKGFLSRFGDVNSHDSSGTEQKSLGFHIPGRRRGQSGSGQELGDVQRSDSKAKVEVTVK